ncbi:MAG: electron transfer flavoprotein subunit beta/FixA family protein [Clostridia bacterium]|nr:electron transfer flavoprotein subunit beta/FixA family protein [Clostridia bacterium]
MKILVCIKQVPASNQVRVDEETGVLIRDGVSAKMNPYDLFALEFALQLKERFSCEVDVLTMGPLQAKSVLNEAVYMGADRGVLLSDRKFAGADVIATSYTLAQGIKATGSYDLILCGKQTTDGDTGQVGPEMAEFLGVEHVSNVFEVLFVNEEKMLVKVNFEHHTYEQEIRYPCLLTIEKEANIPRLPSYKRKKQTTDDVISVLSLEDFTDKDPSHYGLNGSETSVERIFSPEKNDDRIMLSGEPSEQVQALYALLKERHVF